MFRSVLAIAILAIALTTSSRAQISVVVSAASTHTASAGDLSKIFGASKLVWDNGHKVEIAEPASANVTKAFYESFLGKSISQVRTEWTKVVLSGEGVAPKKYGDVAALKKALADQPDAIGFIPTAALDGSVKEVYRVMAFIKAE